MYGSGPYGRGAYGVTDITGVPIIPEVVRETKETVIVAELEFVVPPPDTENT
jgi:hypothetical protein